jgi:hypothetical protein
MRTCSEPTDKLDPMEKRRTREVYGLQCWQCRAEIELACAREPKCPHCGALLNLVWRPAETESAEPEGISA